VTVHLTAEVRKVLFFCFISGKDRKKGPVERVSGWVLRGRRKMPYKSYTIDQFTHLSGLLVIF
jgi:hypothetical protein